METIKDIQQKVTKTTRYISIGQVVLNVAMGAGLRYLWQTVNVMQFFGYFTLWQISTTVQVHIFLESVKTLANFEFLADVFIQELRVECDDFGNVG